MPKSITVDRGLGSLFASPEGIDFLDKIGDYIPSTQYRVALGVSTLWEVYDA